MKFHDLLLAAIQRSEIPLRFEPGAEEAVAKPVTEMLQEWVASHLPPRESQTDFDAGARSLALRLLSELEEPGAVS